MSTSAGREPQALAKHVRFESGRMFILLTDGRELDVPVARFPRLKNATEAQRKKWRLIGRGIGLHWEEIDEDVSVASLLGLPC